MLGVLISQEQAPYTYTQTHIHIHIHIDTHNNQQHNLTEPALESANKALASAT